MSCVTQFTDPSNKVHEFIFKFSSSFSINIRKDFDLIFVDFTKMVKNLKELLKNLNMMNMIKLLKEEEGWEIRNFKDLMNLLLSICRTVWEQDSIVQTYIRKNKNWWECQWIM